MVLHVRVKALPQPGDGVPDDVVGRGGGFELFDEGVDCGEGVS